MDAPDTQETCRLVHKRVGSTIAQLCHDKNLTQTTFAKMVCIDRGNFNELLSGARNPRLDTLVKIAEGLDVPLTALFVGLDKTVPSEAVRRPIAEFDGSTHK